MQAKKPTREERRIIEHNKLDPRKWYVQKSSSTILQIVNTETKEVKVLNKS